MLSIAALVKYAVLPYLIGLVLSKIHLKDSVTQFLEANLNILSPKTATAQDPTSRSLNDPNNGGAFFDLDHPDPQCESRLYALLDAKPGSNPFETITFATHRNGQSDPCFSSDQSSLWQSLQSSFASIGCPKRLDKYQVEALLTLTIHHTTGLSCASEETYGKEKAGFLGFCDAGKEHTPILLDHDDLVEVTADDRSTLPCRFHTREGLRITKLSQLTEMVGRAPTSETSAGTCEVKNSGDPLELSLYAVPAGRVFMFAPSYVGEIFELPHVEGSNSQTIYLETLSVSPRVFDVFNFFSREESQELVDRAKAETSESHKIKRSSTGASGYNINPQRTSESGFDTHGRVSLGEWGLMRLLLLVHGLTLSSAVLSLCSRMYLSYLDCRQGEKVSFRMK